MYTIHVKYTLCLLVPIGTEWLATPPGNNDTMYSVCIVSIHIVYIHTLIKYMYISRKGPMSTCFLCGTFNRAVLVPVLVTDHNVAH